MALASLTGFVGSHGLYPIFALMAAAAVVPAGSELVMLYAGALASGALAEHVSVFGHHVASPGWAFVAVVVAGTLGNLCGAVCGWLVGAYGGRALVLRHGRFLHADEARLARAEQRLERAGGAPVAVLTALPIVRSFVAVPAGITGMPLRRFVPLALVGCLAFSLALAGAGLGLGASWGSAHAAFRYVDVLAVAAVAALAAALLLRGRLRRAAASTDRV